MKVGGLFADFSKNHIDAETQAALFAFAEDAGFTDWRQRMFAGEAINSTENRAAWHVALRDTRLLTDVLREQVEHERCRGEELVRNIHRSAKYTDVVNIGIGGSHLGPEFVCKALSALRKPIVRPHFLSHTDPRTRSALLASLDPQKTLVVIASKSFTTIETSVNTKAVLDWLTENGISRQRLKEQVITVSANAKAVSSLGIPENHRFTMHEWVGGRYSMWSSIGLPIAIAFGNDEIVALHVGARTIDNNFLCDQADENLALILGLLDIWYASFMACPTRIVLAYNAALRLLPAYLQQLIMESGGKRVQRNGEPISMASAPIIWGGMGQNGQHAFYQLLHQGAHVVPVDFVLAMDEPVANEPGYETLVENFIAQSEALMCGKSADEVLQEGEDADLVPHMTFPGNRPSTSILLDKLDAFHLGQLIALYEHRTFVQGICWNINPFDQMGVELGKRMAGEIGKALRGESVAEHDASTSGLVALLAKLFRRDQ